MEAVSKMKQFQTNYSGVKVQLTYLLSDVLDGWEGLCDPEPTNRKKLAEAICHNVEKEAGKNELTIEEMRDFVDTLKKTFQTMIKKQRDKGSQRAVSYTSVIRCVNTLKPNKGNRMHGRK